MIATLEADGLLIRMDSATQQAHITKVFPSQSWGAVESIPLVDLINACKTILAKRESPYV
jgi:hypothetical protein